MNTILGIFVALIPSGIIGVLLGMYVEPLALAVVLSFCQGILWGILGAAIATS
jgi:hypothetical protein